MPELTEMRRLYEEENLSILQIAQATGRSMGVVHRHLRRVITLRPPSLLIGRHPRTLAHADVQRTVEVYERGLTLREVAAELGIADTTVRYRLEQAGIHLRDRSEAALISPNMRRLPAEKQAEIVAHYQRGANQIEVAELTGVSRATVYNVLNRNGIALRGRSEGVVRAWERKRAGDPPAPKRKRAGAPARRSVAPRPVKRRRLAAVDAEVVGFVASAPLAAMLRVEAGRRDSESEHSLEDVCTQARIDPRQLRTWETGEYRKARFDVADRVLVGMERLWWDVYDPQAYGPGLLHWRQRDDVLAWLDVVDHAAAMWEGEGSFAPLAGLARAA